MPNVQCQKLQLFDINILEIFIGNWELDIRHYFKDYPTLDTESIRAIKKFQLIFFLIFLLYQIRKQSPRCFYGTGFCNLGRQLTKPVMVVQSSHL